MTTREIITPKYYLIGGAVRDKLLGLPVKDFDFAVECQSFQQMKDDLVERGIKIFQERESFLTIRGSHPKYGAVDYVCCRKDGSYTDGRRPDYVEMGTLLDDQKRRDFVINSMAIDEETGEIIDPFGGQVDLKAKILRCVGNTKERFEEDALRILRAIRFSITKGFDVSGDINDYLCYHDYGKKLLSVSKERIYEELRKCFEFDTFKTLETLDSFRRLYLLLFKQIGIKLIPTLK